MPATYNVRLIQAGNIIERIEYEKCVYISEESLKSKSAVNRVNRGIMKCANEDDKIRNREKVLYRARNEVRRLINANVGMYHNDKQKGYKPVFLTLTFEQNITNVKLANKEFRKFIKRLGTYVSGNESCVKYVAVPEFQKRGAVHYHLVVFNLPYIKANVIRQIWSHGHIKINAIDEVDNVGAYVSKYMTKEAADSIQDRLAGNKSYFKSRGLIEPKEIRLLADSQECKLLDKMVNEISETVKYVKELGSEHYGIIKYAQYRGENNCWKDLFSRWQEMLAYQ